MFLMSPGLVCVIHVWNATKDSGEQENYINPSLNPSMFRLKKKNPRINVCKPNSGTRSNHLWIHLRFISLLTWRLKKGLISSPKSHCLATWAVSSQSVLWSPYVPKYKNTGKKERSKWSFLIFVLWSQDLHHFKITHMFIPWIFNRWAALAFCMAPQDLPNYSYWPCLIEVKKYEGTSFGVFMLRVIWQCYWRWAASPMRWPRVAKWQSDLADKQVCDK